MRREVQHTLLARRFEFGLSHLVVRLVATVNLADFWLATLYPPYFRGLARQLGHAIVKEQLASSMLLPLFVGFEAWWMRNSEAERNPLLIDAAFVVVWFFVLWAGIFYAFGHYAMF